MDFFGLGPIIETEEILSTPITKVIQDFFYRRDGLTKYLFQPLADVQIRGYIIEVKSRSSKNFWAPFQYSFSENQEKMFSQSQRYNFEVILCGVTFAQDWEIGVIFTNLEGKILSQEYFTQGQ